jgi:hypothetical protein
MRSVLLDIFPTVPVNASSDEPSDSEPRSLTPEEREKLRLLAQRLQRVSMPKFNFKIPYTVDTSAFTKVVADAVRLSRFALPDSALNNVSALVTLQARALESLRPALDVQHAWTKQFDVINSDIFKTHAATQTQFANLGVDLVKTIDFGIKDSLAEAAQRFVSQQSSWLKTLGPTLERLRDGFYPLNLRGIEHLEFEDVEKVVMADGIALYGVPRTAIAVALVRADSAARRREILGRRWKTISADCREAVVGCRSGAVAPYLSFAFAALDALDGGHTAAAQALAGSLIDSLLSAYFGRNRWQYTPDKKGRRTTKAYEEFTVRQFVAFAPMWQAYQQFWVDEGDAIPTTFSRNATAHAVSPRQFNRRNAVQALLFAASLLCFLDEQASQLEAA